jgi:tRNA(adenine34) deaminase
VPNIPPLDEKFMRIALDQAAEAGRRGEVPVGAVIVAGEKMIAAAGNRTITDCDPTAHAEMVVLRAAAKEIGNHRIGAVTLYVTIEPCAMCAGAMIQARIARLVYGAEDRRRHLMFRRPRSPAPQSSRRNHAGRARR